MEKEVLLTLTGRQRDGEGNETVTQFSAPAEYYERNGCLYVLYEETAENGELTKNTIKLRAGMLEVTRRGAINTRMVFEEGFEHMTDYATSLGVLRLGINTHSVKISQAQDQTEMTTDYTLTDGDRDISDCNISIKLQNRGKLFTQNCR